MMQFLDPLLVAIIVALLPLYSWFEVRKEERRLSKPDAALFDTVRDYKRTIAILALLGVLCLVSWFYQDRSADSLGISGGATPLRWLLGVALALLGLGLSWLQGRQMDRNPAAREAMRRQMDRFSFLLPSSEHDLRWFNGVAAAAGLFEEILYRGFLIWYLQQWMGPVPALLLSSMAFGVAHSYQGIRNLPNVTVVGLWLGGVFLLSGSLWPAMIAHFVFDVIAGRMILTALRDEENDSSVRP